MSQAVDAVELDQHLAQIVQALKRAVNYAIPHANDADIAAQAVHDCDEILAVVLAGDVAAWLD